MVENKYHTDEITQVCNEIRDMLIEKNRKYGDSVFNPVRMFSKSSAVEQIKVRIDDKLSRLKNIQEDDIEDSLADLLGYLIILRIAYRLKLKE